MKSNAFERLAAKKQQADQNSDDRENYAGYIRDRVADGWTPEDVAAYRAEVERIMKTGSPDEQQAAREFWRGKVIDTSAAQGINARI